MLEHAHTKPQEAEVSPLLLTKLRAPKLRSNLLPRLELLDKLEEGREGLLTLVTAPPGFGKTTLVSQWLQYASLNHAWLSLDEADNDSVQFWLYLVSGIRSGWPDFAIRALELLQASPDPPFDVILADVINDLNAAPLVLVLDDYHLIANPEIHSRLTFLLDHAPPELYLVIISRSDPPLPLARLRAKNQLCEITASELRASQEESRDFLRQVMKLELSDEDVHALEQRTEGWLAGLQLAALSLRGQEDASSVIDSFTGNNRYVLDYLTAEVLRHQEEDVQQFLLETSILTRLSASLCDAVTERSDGQAVLERLEGEHLFIASLDSERRWYRYHALFADLLQYQLKRFHEGKVQGLHRRAGAWFEQHGHVAEAISHYRAAKEIGLAAKLIGRTIHKAPTTTGMRALLGWFDALPAEIAQAFPKLILGKAWVTLLAERPDVIASLMQGPVASHPEQPDLHDDIERLKGLIEAGESLEKHVEGSRDPWLEGTIVLSLATGYYHHGAWETAKRAYEWAYDLLERSRRRYGMLGALLSIASIDRLQGRLTAAAHNYKKMLSLATDEAGNIQPIAGHALIGLGKVMCERYELRGARDSVLQGIELGASEEPSVLLNGQQTLALVLRCQGDIAGALEALEKAKAIAEANGLTPVIIRLDSYGAQLSLSQGDIEAARQWAARSGLSPHGEISYVTHPDYLTLAQVLMVSGSAHEAVQLLKRLERLAEQQARTSHLLDVLVLKGLALAQLEQEREALTVLELVLTLTQAERQVRPLVMYGQPVQRLLEGLPADSAAYPYAQQVLALPQGAAGEVVTGPVQPAFTPDGLPIEPLSDRELTVLRLLVGGMSNKEIAKEIYVSVNTVKTHVRNVYSKLNVTSRAQLVARVGESGLFHKA